MTRLLGKAFTVLLVCVAIALTAWFAISALTGATLITFRTGSMAPTMPQGAMAITVPVAAAELQPGDVVTVPRGGDQLPVTHRVVEVNDPPSDSSANKAPANARALVLRGDANKTNDDAPYVVTEARKVVFSVAGAGAALMTLQSPIGLGTLTLLVAALLFWAFWPRQNADETSVDEDDSLHENSEADTEHPRQRHPVSADS